MCLAYLSNGLGPKFDAYLAAFETGPA